MMKTNNFFVSEMAHKSIEVHTWTCTIPDCDAQITGYGAGHAEENGWAHEILFGEDFDLCPPHLKELKGFLF